MSTWDRAELVRRELGRTRDGRHGSRLTLSHKWKLGTSMLPNEKDKLLGLLDREQRWCREAEARDVNGSPVKFHDPSATSWDITGAICHLFGWKRACALFVQFERHVQPGRRLTGYHRDAVIEAMVVLQTYNDQPETGFEGIRTLVETMPVWNGVSRSTDAFAPPAHG